MRDTDETNDWLVPVASDAEADRSYASGLRIRFESILEQTLAEFQNLRGVVQETSVDFRVRSHKTEPFVRGVMIVRRRGVLGVYTIDELAKPASFVYSRHAVTLCACDTEGPFVEATAANFLMQWFDELWTSDQLSRAVGACLRARPREVALQNPQLQEASLIAV